MTGESISHFEIFEKLGEGGMGVVYRARDTKLNRDVAIKVLPEALARDTTRMTRFRREAQLLAQLNHPNIAGIHGVEESDGRYALVMELAEGPTLADRLGEGAIPLDESLPIARQIAEALEAAHEKGIIHRDLKPANIKVSDDGQVKVLDFGLAKALEGDPETANPEQSPTLTVGATQAGVILGTAAYMSPEQARGRPADKRADIWSFGVVLYEMLTGRQMFGGETVSDSLAGVLKTEIRLDSLPADTPASVRRVLRRCLERDRRNRLHDIADARIELSDTATEPAAQQPAMEAPRRSKLPWLVAAACLLAGLLLGRLFISDKEPAPETVRFEIPPPEGSRIGTSAVSPDGRKVAYAVTGPEGRHLWMRDLNTLESRRIEGSEIGHSPFWAPDSRQLGFRADTEYRSLDVDSGTVQVVGEAFVQFGSTWNRDGVLAYSAGGRLYRADRPGTERRPVLSPESGEQHLWPRFLPDGDHLLFMVVTTDRDQHEIHVTSLSGGGSKRVAMSESDAKYASGHLLFLRGGALMAQPFDTKLLELTGDPVRLVADVAAESDLQGLFSASDNGVLVYRATEGAETVCQWLDRSGTPLGPLTSSLSVRDHVEISPDGRRVSIDTGRSTGGTDIWMVDAARGTADPLITGDGADWVSEWSPDGTRLAFTSNRDDPAGRYQIYVANLETQGVVEPLLVNEQSKHHMTWSPDGKQIVYEVSVSGTFYDLWVLPLEGDSKPYELLATEFVEGQPRFSPDSRWLAYISDASGQMEVYVTEFRRELARPVRVSTAGGVSPRWRNDGKELYYLAADGSVMAVPVETAGTEFRPGKPNPLFKTAMLGISSTLHFTVTGDGQRFLIHTPVTEEKPKPLTVVLNWTAELEK